MRKIIASNIAFIKAMLLNKNAKLAKKLTRHSISNVLKNKEKKSKSKKQRRRNHYITSLKRRKQVKRFVLILIILKNAITFTQTSKKILKQKTSIIRRLTQANLMQSILITTKKSIV